MTLGITETVLRDGNQSLIATRLPLGRFEGILDTMDKAGYYSLECWGGATFDSCIRYINEDPWERLRVIRRLAPGSKLQMLLRGKSLLGYRHYPDDVVRRFVYHSIENGIDIIRIFDALNDVGNIAVAVGETLRCGAHPSCAISYTESPVHSVAAFVELAVQMESIGAKSVCVKDMSGILTPTKAYELIKTLKERLSVPVILHSHCSGGLAYMSYLKAIEAGVDVLDTAISSFSGGTSQPATEVVCNVAGLYGRDCGLDMERLEKIDAFFSDVIGEFYRNRELELASLQTDTGILRSQIPGGMYSNLRKQLADQNCADKFGEIVREIPLVRKDLGYPPLVTPMSQMVGTQAMINVVTGSRYSHLCNEVKSYLRGEYGSAPGVISPDLDLMLPSAENGGSGTGAFSWEDEKERLGALCKDDTDVLTCVMFPQLGESFIAGRDKPAACVMPQNGEKQREAAGMGQVNACVRSIYEYPDYTDVEPDYDAFVDFDPAPGAKDSAGGAGHTVLAVLPGTIIKVCKSVNDSVAAGEPLLIFESMKMQNEIISPIAGRVAKVHVKVGDQVSTKEKLVEMVQ